MCSLKCLKGILKEFSIVIKELMDSQTGDGPLENPSLNKCSCYILDKEWQFDWWTIIIVIDHRLNIHSTWIMPETI